MKTFNKKKNIVQLGQPNQIFMDRMR